MPQQQQQQWMPSTIKIRQRFWLPFSQGNFEIVLMSFFAYRFIKQWPEERKKKQKHVSN